MEDYCMSTGKLGVDLRRCRSVPVGSLMGLTQVTNGCKKTTSLWLGHQSILRVDSPSARCLTDEKASRNNLGSEASALLKDDLGRA